MKKEAAERWKTNLVHFVAARRTLIAIIRIVSAVMDVETHTPKHEQQKCDHIYIHTIYKSILSDDKPAICRMRGQARGVKPKAEPAAER